MANLYISRDSKTKEIDLLNGANKFKILPSSTMSSNLSLTLPPTLGSANQILTTDGTGALSWVSSTSFILNGVSVQSQLSNTNLDEKTITFSTPFAANPAVVATTEGSSADFTDRYLSSIISTIGTASFTYGNYMKYNAKGVISTTSGSYYDLIINGNKYPMVVYINGTTLYAKLSLSIEGSNDWGFITTINSTVANTKPSLVVLTNLTNGVAYRSNTNTLLWSYNYKPNGWITTIVDATVGSGSDPKAKLLSNGMPVIMALNTNNLYTYLSANLSGTSTWGSNLALINVVSFDFNYLSTNYPAIIYFDSSVGQLIMVTNTVDDMSGSWTTINFITGATNVTAISMCILANGNPACSYYDSTTNSLRFAVSNNASGSAGWNIYIIGTSTGLAPVTILNDGTPAISYINAGVLYMTKNAAIDGSGLWSTSIINNGPINSVGSLIMSTEQLPSVVYDDGSSLYYERSCLDDRFPATTSYTINWAAVATT